MTMFFRKGLILRKVTFNFGQVYHNPNLLCRIDILWVAKVFPLGEELFKAEEASNTYRTWDEYVDPEWQKMGVAEKLFKRFKEIMLKENVRMLVVDTEAENIPALKLFRKLGFRNPQQHIYLTMNLENDRQHLKRKENGGSS